MRWSSTLGGLGFLTAASAQLDGLKGGSASSVLGQKPESRVARNVLEGKSEGYCSPSGPIESTHCLYEQVESLNQRLFPALHELVTTPFFRHYKVDLYRECPFWYENGFCMNRNCGVEELNESEIPEKWRAAALSEVRVSGSEDEGVSGCYFKEQDFCYVEDDADFNGQYVDLTLNPERFTGYSGDSAHRVWRAIYEENCFGLSEASLSELSKPSSAAPPGLGLGSSKSKSELASAVVGAGGVSKPGDGSSAPGWGFSKLSEGWGTEMVKAPATGEEMCEEKKVYYRVISGLHASISIHICAEYMDQTTGEWAPNLDCFISRLATHPERLSNVYFNAVLLLRAVARAAPYLEKYDISTAQVGVVREGDAKAKTLLGEVLGLAGSEGIAKGFDEGDFFAGQDAGILKEQFKSHFRNVSRIMDCVGCDKCRLWGKLQVTGIGTALKILFELDDKAFDPKINPDLLQRSEVVALINTLHRISESLASVEQFRKIYADTQQLESQSQSSKTKTKPSKAKPPKAAKSSIPSKPHILDGLLDVLGSLIDSLKDRCWWCLDFCLKKVESGGGGYREFGSSVRRWVGGVGLGREL
ncbi:hypothetical protein L202_06879 [Cryptococcus amylolentus CBS 6039]|uniref:Endoplasmic oxidoreductin 1 n=3 Tax=Cryptococcus amylolentus TaxID=104669 RepID=A0A1E3HDS9_9TREE|nr:hypothetical protein L202_06879 [Cryptococcus amylolentus CBS 6039]ODN74499.1 hypothetical protein L202_06879 [Cryptococcus amylolentus CBS 6039]ODO01484.1 hypothetical protein I350_06304 [Cryptococcus amylolentus CBS 6273]